MTTQQPSGNSSEIKDGYYQKCRAVPSGVQVGFSEHKGAPEMIIPCTVPDLGGREVQVILHFSTEQNAQISLEQVRATGWKGKEVTDLSDLSGMGEKEFTIEVYHETWNNESRMKTRIVSGGGRIKSSKPTDLKTFAAAVAMVMGKKPNAGGPPPPPFGD